MNMEIHYSTRLVFLIGGIVIKIPLSYRGYLQCKNEKKIFNTYHHLNVLGVLYKEFMGIIIMKRYQHTDVIPDDVVYGIKYLIKEFDIQRCDLYNPANWGIDNGEYVLIDYGISDEISKLYK